MENIEKNDFFFQIQSHQMESKTNNKKNTNGK